MSRYIDADKLKPMQFVNWTNICSAPSIDIVRCKDCKHGEYREDFNDYLCCEDGISVHDAEWYCADGERVDR